VYPAVISVTIFAVYFTDAVVGNEEGLGDLWWGRVISISMLFVALSSPIMGSIADRAGVRKRMMGIYTGLCVVCVILFITIEPGMILWAALLAILANIGFEGAMVFYNAYLPDLVPAEKQGRVSGLGFGLGYLGSAVGLGIAYPLVARGALDITWIMVAVFFALFSIPSFLWLPADGGGSMSVGSAARAGILGFRKLVADVSAGALENAIRVEQAIGGSTNTPLHILAIAHAAEIDLSIDAFDRLSREVPQLVSLRPGGELMGKGNSKPPVRRWRRPWVTWSTAGNGKAYPRWSSG